MNSKIYLNVIENPKFNKFNKKGRKGGKGSIILSSLLSLLCFIPFTLSYIISVGFIIGGFNYVSSNIFFIGRLPSKIFLYHLTTGLVGLLILTITIYLNIALIKFVKYRI